MNIGFCWKTRRKSTNGSPKCRSDKNIKLDSREIEWSRVHLINLALDRDQWRAVVSTVINFRVPQNFAKCVSQRMFASQEGLGSMSLVLDGSLLLWEGILCT
jgi:hypothetical protein